MRSIPLTVLGLVLAAGPLLGASRPDWERELRQMGYAFLHLSNINAVNGLNLTREQAVELRRLARQVERVAESPPDLQRPASREMEPVRTAWVELRGLLLEGGPVPPELEQRVNSAREVEARLLRRGLRPEPAAYTTACSSCHQAVPDAARTELEPLLLVGQLSRLADQAHAEATYGKRGLAKMIALSPQVEEVLSEGQKAVLSSFTCCLVPPQSLSDPVRAGQADSDERVVALLRRVRSCPDSHWPLLRGAILRRVGELKATVKTGARSADQAAASADVGKVLDHVRQLSDTAFAVEKDELSHAVRQALIPDRPEWTHKAAYFLLIPGAGEAYDGYIRRLDRATP